ncbi:MAG: DNA alkylation repair protein [Anaerotignum sp.]|nr:DNA alkylation repair protein [Anaerotignum sp.]
MSEKWTKRAYAAYRQELFSQGEERYRQFQEKLICSDLPVIGLRMPFLRKQAAQLAKEDGEGFLRFCGRKTHEERLLYGLVAAALPVPYEKFLEYADIFVEELVENWALCDAFCASLKKRIKGREDEFYTYILKYLSSSNPWAVRVGLVVMLNHYLGEAYLEETLRRTDRIQSEFYYVRMAQAWLLATAWAKDRAGTAAYLPHATLEDWTFHKFIQKTCESYRVSAEDKAYLRGLKKEREKQ